MYFQLLILLLILFAAFYFSAQGVFSGLIMLACCTFASTLAMGVFEPVAALLAKWRPDYASGVAFLAIFCVALGLLRFAAGFVLPRNIKLPDFADYIGGGLLGFINAMIIFGTLVIGLGMLPLYQTLLGYERYPNGVDKSADTLWIPAGDFTVGLWRLASGGAMGGTDIGTVDPEPIRTFYGYRHTVQPASRKSVNASLVTLDKAIILKDADLQTLGIPSVPGKQDVLIRLIIDKGSGTDISADDTGNSLMHTTPTQLHIVTDKMIEFFPIGYMQDGTTYTATDVQKAALIEDYPKNDKIPQDWIFQIPADQSPSLVAYKELSRFDVSNARAGAYVAFAGGYPPLGYMKTAPLINVEVTSKSGAIEGANVIIVGAGVIKRRVEGAINKAYDDLVAHDQTVMANIFNRLKTTLSPDDTVQWDQLATMMVDAARLKTDDSPARYKPVMDNVIATIRGALNSSQPVTPILITNSSGAITPQRLATGPYTVIVWRISPTEFDFWTTSLSATSDQILKFDVDSADVHVTPTPK